MRGILIAITIAMTAVFSPAMRGDTPIIGEAEIEIDHMVEYIRQHNADFPREIAQAYYVVGRRYGIRGDIALCQAILETGWFTFCGGTAVTIDQNNFCGLGVTALGVKGLSFPTVEQGVTAQMQHLFAYACRHPLPSSETLLDPRFSLVSRGSAPTWEKLSGRWAANRNYGRDIMALFARALDFRPVASPASPESTESPEEISSRYFD